MDDKKTSTEDIIIIALVCFLVCAFLIALFVLVFIIPLSIAWVFYGLGSWLLTLGG